MNGLKVNQDKIKNGMGMGDFGQKAKQIKLPIRNQSSKIWKKGLVWVHKPKRKLRPWPKISCQTEFSYFYITAIPWARHTWAV